jgi:hypothetical protein
MITDLKQDKKTPEKEGDCLGSLLDEYASADATYSAERELVEVDS